jgi:hypothetical protein
MKSKVQLMKQKRYQTISKSKMKVKREVGRLLLLITYNIIWLGLVNSPVFIVTILAQVYFSDQYGEEARRKAGAVVYSPRLQSLKGHTLDSLIIGE